MSGRMRQVEVYDAVEESGQDIAVFLYESGILPAAERKAIEEQFQLWEFGKWALLGDSSAQHIKRRLQYQAKYKQAPTFWQSNTLRLLSKHLFQMLQLSSVKPSISARFTNF